MTLSEKGIGALEPPAKGRRLIFDDHRDAPKGFGVRVTAAGNRSFILRYKAEGHDRLLTIGEHGKNKWSLAAARTRAGELRREIDGGVDILEQRRIERGEPTVSDVMDRYCTARVDDLASGDSVRKMLTKHLLPEVGKKKIARIRRRDVIALLEGVASDHPRQAGKLLAYIKQLWAYAEDREIIEGNPVATLKAAKIGQGLTSRNRARVLDNDEIKALWENADTCGMHKLTALALKLVLVTGQRPGEVAGMRWDEIDGDLWTIPAERRRKTDTAHIVPLTETALALLEAVKAETDRLAKRRRKKPAGFVFEARPGQALTTAGMSRAVNRYPLGDTKTKTWGHWRPHDLRRTCRTGLAAAGVNETVAELTIGHTRKGIEGVYDLHKYDHEKRAALEAWERRLLRIIEGKPADDNVTPIKRSA